MIVFKKNEEAAGSGTLLIEGELTIFNAEEFRLALLDSLTKVNHLVLDVSNVESIDLTGLQLFCSAHRTFCVRGKSVVVKGINVDSIKYLAQESGLGDNSCDISEMSKCFWAQGGPNV